MIWPPPRAGTASQAELDAAYEAMLFAEGSDWFWWYGSDQESGDDEYFDTAFRALLGEVYLSLGQEVPDFVAVPIIAEEPIAAEGQPAGLLTATIDGEQEAAWDQSGAYLIDQSVLRWGLTRKCSRCCSTCHRPVASRSTSVAPAVTRWPRPSTAYVPSGSAPPR